MNIARSTALGLIALGALGNVLGLLLPWSGAGGHPDLATTAGIAFVGPVLTVVCLVHARSEPDRLRLVAALAGVGSLVAAFTAGTLVRLVNPAEGVAGGGPCTVVGAAMAVLGWLVGAVAGPGPLAKGRPLLVAGGVIALLLAAAGWPVSWYVEGRFVDARTGGGSAGAPVNWQRTLPDGALVGAERGQAFVLARDGVTAYRADTGAPSWHYRRSDRPARAAGLVDHAIVTVFGNGHGLHVTAHEAADGRQRFSHRYTRKSWHPTRVVAAGDLIVLAGTGPDSGDVVALERGSGSLAWTWRPERDGAPCDVAGVAADPLVTAVALRCRATGVRDLVVGLSTRDGRERWSWRAEPATDQSRGPEPELRSAGTGFLVRHGPDPRQAVSLDQHGAPGPRHQPPGTLVALHGAVAVYGTSATLDGVSSVTGQQLWRVELPGLAQYHPVHGTVFDTTLYVVVRSDEGATRVVATDLGTGRTPVDVAVPCSSPCTEPRLAVSEAGAVITTRNPTTATLTLSRLP